MNKKIVVLALLATNIVCAKEAVVINEKKLKELMTNNVPSIEKINTVVIQSNLERTQYNQKYSTFLNGQANYSNVEGKMFEGYQGQFDDPARRYGISVS